MGSELVNVVSHKAETFGLDQRRFEPQTARHVERTVTFATEQTIAGTDFSIREGIDLAGGSDVSVFLEPPSNKKVGEARLYAFLSRNGGQSWSRCPNLDVVCSDALGMGVGLCSTGMELRGNNSNCRLTYRAELGGSGDAVTAQLILETSR